MSGKSARGINNDLEELNKLANRKSSNRKYESIWLYYHIAISDAEYFEKIVCPSIMRIRTTEAIEINRKDISSKLASYSIKCVNPTDYVTIGRMMSEYTHQKPTYHPE